MLQIILLILGIVLLFKKSIQLTKKKELKKPHTLYLGIFLVLWSIIAFFIDFGAYTPLLFVVPFFATIVISSFVKEEEIAGGGEKGEEEKEKQEDKK